MGARRLSGPALPADSQIAAAVQAWRSTMCAVDVGESPYAERPSSFAWLLGFLITGAVVPPSHLVRADLDRVAQVMSVKLGYPRP